MRKRRKRYGAELLSRGADHLDVGAQASHGDAAFVTPEQEWEIVEGPLKGLLSLGVEVSIDTWQVETARRALDAGACVLNAADALQSEEMIELAASRGPGCVALHVRTRPSTSEAHRR